MDFLYNTNAAKHTLNVWYLKSMNPLARKSTGCDTTNQAAVRTKGLDLRRTSELLDLPDRQANNWTGNHKNQKRFVIVVVTVDTTDDHVKRQKTLHIRHVVRNDISRKCANQRIKRCMFFWITIVRKYLF